MKLRSLGYLMVIACIFGSAHYNEKYTVTITLPSPAQFVDTVGKMKDELKESAELGNFGIEVHSSPDGTAMIPCSSTEIASIGIYSVRPSWDDEKGQIGVYSALENAIANCPSGYFVFDENGRMVYDPCVN